MERFASVNAVKKKAGIWWATRIHFNNSLVIIHSTFKKI